MKKNRKKQNNTQITNKENSTLTPLGFLASGVLGTERSIYLRK